MIVSEKTGIAWTSLIFPVITTTILLSPSLLRTNARFSHLSSAQLVYDTAYGAMKKPGEENVGAEAVVYYGIRD